MSDYIQIGVTALRDPATGNFLPSVPMYARREDAATAAPLAEDEGILKELAMRYGAYMEGVEQPA